MLQQGPECRIQVACNAEGQQVLQCMQKWRAVQALEEPCHGRLRGLTCAAGRSEWSGQWAAVVRPCAGAARCAAGPVRQRGGGRHLQQPHPLRRAALWHHGRRPHHR